MIRNDLHVHSIQSACGVHTIFELIEIAAIKDVQTINICDHGEASGRYIDFGVITNKNRCPRTFVSKNGKNVEVLAGIEVNILNKKGGSDFPLKYFEMFDLVSAGFHNVKSCEFLECSAQENTIALENYLIKYPLDILTHPCIKKFPLLNDKIVSLSCRYGFALEVNNTNLYLGKTDIVGLKELITLAIKKGANLIECSDGHIFTEIGENDAINELLWEMNLDGNSIFLNRNDERFHVFIMERKGIRLESGHWSRKVGQCDKL